MISLSSTRKQLQSTLDESLRSELDIKAVYWQCCHPAELVALKYGKYQWKKTVSLYTSSHELAEPDSRTLMYELNVDTTKGNNSSCNEETVFDEIRACFKENRDEYQENEDCWKKVQVSVQNSSWKEFPTSRNDDPVLVDMVLIAAPCETRVIPTAVPWVLAVSFGTTQIPTIEIPIMRFVWSFFIRLESCCNFSGVAF